MSAATRCNCPAYHLGGRRGGGASGWCLGVCEFIRRFPALHRLTWRNLMEMPKWMLRMLARQSGPMRLSELDHLRWRKQGNYCCWEILTGSIHWVVIHIFCRLPVVSRCLFLSFHHSKRFQTTYGAVHGQGHTCHVLDRQKRGPEEASENGFAYRNQSNQRFLCWSSREVATLKTETNLNELSPVVLGTISATVPALLAYRRQERASNRVCDGAQRCAGSA